MLLILDNCRVYIGRVVVHDKLYQERLAYVSENALYLHELSVL